MSTKGRESPISCNAPLYRFVFRGTISFTTVFMLCAAFVFSSVHLAFADEENLAATTPDNVVQSETIATDTENSDAQAEPEMPDEVSVETSVDGEVSDTVPVEENISDTNATEDVLASTTDDIEENFVGASSEGSAADGGELVNDDPEVLNDLPETEADAGEVGKLPSMANDEVLKEGTVLGTSTEATSTPVQVDTITNDSNYYQFSREECVRVSDGSFYCGDTNEEAEEVVEDGLFAAPDSDGDLEIFLRYEGIETKITNNTVDDAAPYYDSLSDTLVWHRLINDRYQIIAYDIESGEEEQLTHGSENSMEPSRYGALTVWQAWIGNSWDIVLSDGGAVKRLTESPEHDVAPLAYESYVLWNTTGEDGVQQIAMYDLDHEETTLIKDEDGSSVRNPRMVLVYETANEHGDIMTKGFDLKSKTVVPLSATPKSIPKEIPESDQTGETRALIQNKSSGRESELGEVIPEPVATSTGSSTPPVPDEASIASSTSSSNSVATTSNTVLASTSAPTAPEDIVVPAYQAPQESVTQPVDPATIITDVVIPPFSATTTE